jgi:hypothetical protein
MLKTLACCLALGAVPTATTAQVSHTGPASLFTSDMLGIMTPVPGGEPEAADTANGFALTGDMNIDLTGRSVGDDPYVGLVGQRPFTVGPLPVQADVHLDVDLKFVNGLGTRTYPETTVAAYLVIQDVATGTAVYELYADLSQSLAGNGIAFLNGTDAAGPWVLSPNRTYCLWVGLDTIMVPSLDPMGPTSVTVEFGGVTTYGGLDATLTGVVVPEPATLCLLAVLALSLSKRDGLALMRRRR